MNFLGFGNYVGTFASLLLFTLLVQSARLLLKHSIAVWSVRSPGDEESECLFTVQNLEPVPISTRIIVILEERGDIQSLEGLRAEQAGGNETSGVSGVGMSVSITPANAAAAAAGESLPVQANTRLTQVPVSAAQPPAAAVVVASPVIKPRLRVYSGANRPLFVHSIVQQDRPPVVRETRIEFADMAAYATWSIRLRTASGSVTMRLAAGDTVVGANRFPFRSIGLDLSVRSVELGVKRAVTQGPRKLPTWATGITVACLGPLLYGIALWALVTSRVLQTYDASLPLDSACALGLGVAGICWFLWVRRPVLPAIQAYRSYWVPGADEPQTD